MSTTVTYKGQTITTAENQTKKLLTAGKYMEDDVTIEDVTQGGALIMGVIRPDAELVQKWHYDERIVSDLGITIPAYSTTFINLVNSYALTSVTIDRDNYDYYATCRWLCTPIYDDDQIVSGLREQSIGALLQEFLVIPSDTFISKNGTPYSAIILSSASHNYNAGLYWNNNQFRVVTNTMYGPIVQPSAATIGTNITMYHPTYRIMGNSTYFPQAVWEKLTDIRYQVIMELYRVKRNNSFNLDGWGIRQELLHANDCIKHDGNLT